MTIEEIKKKIADLFKAGEGETYKDGAENTQLAWQLVAGQIAVGNFTAKDYHQKMLEPNQAEWAIINGIGDLPPEKWRLVFEAEIHGEMSELPEAIGDARNVRRIFAEKLGLKRLPETMANLQKLEAIHLQGSKFEAFPTVLLSCAKLSTLNLSESGIKSVPDEIDQLKNMEHLMLDGNPGLKLPDCRLSFGGKLKSVFLQQNDMNEFPMCFRDVEIDSMFLADNQIHSLPGEWGARLDHLHIEGTPMEVANTSVFSKMQLKTFAINRSKVRSFSDPEGLSGVQLWTDKDQYHIVDGYAKQHGVALQNLYVDWD